MLRAILHRVKFEGVRPKRISTLVQRAGAAWGRSAGGAGVPAGDVGVREEPRLDPSRHQQNDDEDEQQSNAAAQVISPTADSSGFRDQYCRRHSFRSTGVSGSSRLSTRRGTTRGNRRSRPELDGLPLSTPVRVFRKGKNMAALVPPRASLRNVLYKFGYQTSQWARPSGIWTLGLMPISR
jgi:hypothetical protein